jgi:hypothetical protein
MVLMQGLMLLMVSVWSHGCCILGLGDVDSRLMKTTLDKG